MNRFALVATSLSTLLGSLSGCGAPNPLMGPGHTPTYADGFNDGCSSETRRRTSRTPTGRTSRSSILNSSSAEGWTAGYKKCEDAQIAQLMKIPNA